MAVNSNLGEKMKELRLKRGMTLKQVGEQVGLSQGFLSQVENGRATLGMHAMMKVADLFDTDVAAFFGRTHDAEGSNVIRSYERRGLQVSSEFIQYSIGSAVCGDQVSIHIFEIYPGRVRESEQVVFNHDAAEFMYVLEGALTQIVNGEKTVLYPGDCIHIPSNTDHLWANETGQMVKVLSVQLFRNNGKG